MVRLLLEKGANPDSKDGDDRTAMSLAAEKGEEAVVKLQLTTGRVDRDSKDKISRTPLSYAAEKRHDAIVKLLLATGRVDPNSKATGGAYKRQTPLSIAAEKGYMLSCCLRGRESTSTHRTDT